MSLSFPQGPCDPTAPRRPTPIPCPGSPHARHTDLLQVLALQACSSLGGLCTCLSFCSQCSSHCCPLGQLLVIWFAAQRSTFSAKSNLEQPPLFFTPYPLSLFYFLLHTHLFLKLKLKAPHLHWPLPRRSWHSNFCILCFKRCPLPSQPTHGNFGPDRI